MVERRGQAGRRTRRREGRPPPVRGTGAALGNVGSRKDADAGSMLPGRGAAAALSNHCDRTGRPPADMRAPQDPLLPGEIVTPPCAPRAIRKSFVVYRIRPISIGVS